MPITDIARALFGVNLAGVPFPQSTSTIYGTAVSNSVNGYVRVIMDGQAITQPNDEEETETIPSSSFIDGRAELEHPAYPGTVSIIGSDGEPLLEDQFQVDGRTLTINELVGDKYVEVSYSSDITMTVKSEEFNSDKISLTPAPKGEITVTLDDEIIESTYADGELTVPGSSIDDDASFVIDYDVPISIMVKPENGVCNLTDAPKEVTVIGRILSSTADPIEAELQYTLDESILTILSTEVYDSYEVRYIDHRHIETNWSDTVVTSEPDDDEEEPVIISSGIVDLGAEPDSKIVIEDDEETLKYVVTVTKNGEPYDDYSVSSSDLSLIWTPGISKLYRISYVSDVTLPLVTSAFANGTYKLPYFPNGKVTVKVDGEEVQSTVDEYMLDVPSLVSDISEYTVTYRSEISSGEVLLPTAPSVLEGEIVQISVINGSPRVTSVLGEGDRQDDNIKMVELASAESLNLAEIARDLANAAAAVANAIEQHVWTDGTGLHITAETKESWLEHPDGYGTNALMNSEGLLFREANKLRLAITAISEEHAGLAIYDGLDNEEDNIIASFSSRGITLGSIKDYVRLNINRTSGISFIEGEYIVAYASGNEFNAPNITFNSALTASTPVGDWAWVPRSNGNFALKWIG